MGNGRGEHGEGMGKGKGRREGERKMGERKGNTERGLVGWGDGVKGLGDSERGGRRNGDVKWESMEKGVREEAMRKAKGKSGDGTKEEEIG